ncbi:MAG: outer membrane beta-barrel protein [Ignavibacteriales bacterium]|nr:outer membrane beta-barrel protein [Ignavibacteriales bacterium]
MKTSVFSFVAVLLISFVTLAQSMNGKVTLGGELSINSQELKYENNYSSYSKNEKQSDFNFGPRLGYFLNDNLQFGIGLNYQGSSYDFEGVEQYYSSERSFSLFYINPSLRYYNELSTNFGFWGQLSFNVGFGSRKDTEWEYNGNLTPPKVETEYDLMAYSFSFGPGVYYFLNDHFEINLSLGSIYYTSMSTTVTKPKLPEEPKNVQSQFGFDFSFQSLTLGLHYIF